jgi:hypothetical protein
LAQHHVDKGGFAMVNVGDDGDVAKLGHIHFNRLAVYWQANRPWCAAIGDFSAFG